jgi:putative ABC transport system permease protein
MHIEQVVGDVRYAMRGLARAPAFAGAAVLTIALGIGATTSVFTVVYAVLLRPLPYADPSRVALVWATTPDGARTWLSAPELDDIGRHGRSFQAIAGLTDLRFSLTRSGEPEELQVVAASATTFPLLGVRPAIGRVFEPADDREGASEVVLLSHGLWQRRFGGLPTILGRAITLDSRPYTVVGVLPASFSVVPPSSVFPVHVDAWVPLQPHLPSRARDVRFLHAVARLNPGITFPAANQELLALAAAVTRAHGNAYRVAPLGFRAVSMQQDVLSGVRPALVTLSAVVALVLVIVCANVAALLLSRADSRRREMAIRTALGASRARVVRQLITEGVVLAMAGGVAGLTVAGLTPALASLPVLSDLPRFDDVALNWRVLGFAMTTAIGTAVCFGLAPALHLAPSVAPRRMAALRASGRHPSAVRAGRILAASEIALASVVLVVALLLARTFTALLDRDLGFTPDAVVTMRVSLPPAYQRHQVAPFFDTVLAAARQVPGVQSASAVTQLPLSGALLGSAVFADGTTDASRVDLRGMTPDYLAALGIRLLAGRTFGPSDTADGPAVVMVDEMLARRLWPGRSAIGQRMRWIRQPDIPMEVVGVVSAVRHRGPHVEPQPTAYRPHTQYVRRTMTLAVRVAGDPASAAAAVAAAVHRVDPLQPVADVGTLTALVRRSVAQPGFGAALGGALALLATALSAVGVYGLLAYAVAERRREMAVRIALGATRAAIMRLVLGDGIRVALAGLAIGVPLAALAARALRTQAVDVAGGTPVTLAAAVAVLVVVSAGACAIPARRASKVEPASALRNE